MRVYSPEEIVDVVSKLQTVLSLQDWIIDVEMRNWEELNDEDSYASMDCSTTFKKALIKLPDLQSYTGKFKEEYDMLSSIIHEMLHLHWDGVFRSREDGSPLFEDEQEVALNKLCRVFVDLWDDEFPVWNGDIDKCLYDLQELKQVCGVWQEKFGLSHWDIDVDFVDQRSIVDCFAKITIWKYTMHAFIMIPDPYRYSSVTMPKQNMLFGLLHELIHLLVSDVVNTRPNSLENLREEQACNAIARGLVRLVKLRSDMGGD